MSFGWDYPPGVSGNEYEIAGPDAEWDEKVECPDCSETVEVAFQSYGHEAWGECPECTAEITREITNERDPDDERDAIRDRMEDERDYHDGMS